MDLNDLERMQAIDTQDMIGHINGLPDQLAKAWELGQKSDLPAWEGIDRVLIAGMGGSAIGADLLATYAAPLCSIPITVHRDYALPSWAKNENTLVICSSHSGNTEETLSVFEGGIEAECRILAVATGGTLAARVRKAGRALWHFDYDAQPRAAVGYSFGLLLAAFFRLGLVSDPSKDLAEAVDCMKIQQESLLPKVLDTNNPAKQIAGQMMGRWITVWGAGLMGPVARRWKCQLNENAKAQASFEVLPEADHNTLQGIAQPEAQFGATMNVFLKASQNHPRNQLRDDFTRMSFMLEGQNTAFVKAQGESPLAQMWTALHFGDYISYYLAMAYEVDPTPVPMLVDLKEKMKNAG